MDSKKIYIYSGLAILSALAIYGYVSNKKKQEEVLAQGEALQDEVDTTLVTPTGSEIDINQAVLPKDLEIILSKTVTESSNLLRNKTVFSKLDGVKARNGNYVNNGIVNNIMGDIKPSGIKLGKVVSVINDKNNAKNPQGRVYRWIKVLPSQESIDEMNKNKSFLSPKLASASVYALAKAPFYYREDTIKL